MKFTKAKMYTLIALVSAANYVSADNYQYEASIGISDGDVEVGSASGDTESVDLSFKANFSEVDTSKGPLAEADFLDRASSVSFSYSDGEIENIDNDELTGTLKLVDKESGLTGELFISDGEVADVDSESLGISVGYYVAENTELVLGYLNVEVDNSDADTIVLGVKHVSTGEVAYSVEAAVGSVDSDSGNDIIFILGGTFYPTSQLGLGASITTVDSDVDNDTFEVFADWFITPVAAVTLSYTDSEIDVIEADSISVTGRIRF